MGFACFFGRAELASFLPFGREGRRSGSQDDEKDDAPLENRATTRAVEGVEATELVRGQ